MKSELFQKLLLEDAEDSRWTHAYTAQEMLDLINAATPEQINYIPTEGKHKGKSVLWLVAKNCDFCNDKQYKVVEHLLSLSNEDAINASAKTYDFGRNELAQGTSVLSLVAQTTGSMLFKQFKLIATLLEKGARIDADRETHLFWSVSRSYEDAILLRVIDHSGNSVGLEERMASIKAVRDDYAFILANLSTLCPRHIIYRGIYSHDDIKMAQLLRLVINDFVNGVSTIVNTTLSSYGDSLEQDDINTLRELLQMFASEQGKVLLNYVNNTMLLSHELLSTPQQEAAPDQGQKRARLGMRT